MITMRAMTLPFKTLLISAILFVTFLFLYPALLQAQDNRLNPTGDLKSNVTFQDLDGYLNQTIELKFGGEPVHLTLPAGSIAEITLTEVASYIGIMGDEFDLSSYIGIYGDEFDLSSQVGIRRLDQKRYAVRGTGVGALSIQFKNKKGKQAILRITVTEPSKEKVIEKE